MATAGTVPQQQSLTQQRGPGQYQSASVRSVSSVSTSASTASTSETWVGGKKRDWDNAFISKYQEFEATLQENDRWLALYWQSIAGVKDTKRPNVAITEALKASSARRRGRARMDVRDVFNVGGTTMTLSPVGSRFNTSSSWSLRMAKRRSSQYGALQGNTLNMAMAQMAMMPPRSPFLTNVSNETIVSPRSQDSTLNKAPVGFSAATLARSNSAAAKTAAAVKRLQAMATVPVPQVTEMLSPPLSGESQVTMSAALERSPIRAAQLIVPATRFTPSAPVPTLRDMLLNHRQSPVKPPAMSLEPRPRLRTLSSHSSGPSSPEPTAKPSVTSSETELTKSEEDVRERLQRVRIALGRHSMGRIPETPIDEVCEQAQRRIDDIAAAISPDASDAELTALCRDIDEVASMLPPSNDVSQAEEEDDDDCEATEDELENLALPVEGGGDNVAEPTGSDDADEDTSEEERRPPSAPRVSEGVLDVVIDLQPIDLHLDAVDEQSRPAMKHAPGLPGKRKHSDDEKAVPPPAPVHNGSRLMNPTSASLSRGRGRGKVRPAPYTTGIPRNAALRSQASSSSIASSQRSVDDDAHPPRNESRQGAASKASGALAGPGRVAETRRMFEKPAGSFISPVAAMRPGYASIVSTPATAAAVAATGQKRTAVKSKIPSAAKSSTAAMREAARRAEATRINAAAGRKPAQPQLNQSRIGNEPLFKSVARPASSTLLQKSSQSSLRSQPSRELLHPSTSSAADRRVRPAPLQIASSSSSSAIPVPVPAKGKAPATTNASESDASKSSDSGRWGLTSMLSVLSPSKWKSQAAAETPVADATPTSSTNLKKIASPYDVTSPQNPYQPRPEHGGGNRGQLVMPTYKDMAVPLRKSSTRAPSIIKQQKPQPGRPSNTQRLINMTEGGRLSGVSSFRSSFFSDDEGVGASSSKIGQSPGMARTKSTPDLLAQDMVTPIQGMRHKSSISSDEYTTIIPPGQMSPPEIESEYSDEYSDDEFSPAAPRRKKNDFKIPKWATTPELARGLEMQEKVNPDHIFGRVKPLRINEIFNRQETEEQRRKPRNSSMIWNSKDALTSEEELSYVRKMGYDP
ncbi:hypothetical protein GGI19_003037 [Coemansia pectinata]|uniref:Inner centromere protein ARK-binding domain-containing protein n=1 Tax=Coemansia pectinata TaxID=1052879 RepID=A0A9W8H1J5_9FUNG|nr:hypothetical protein GGI19_003037 [Coemansia pectinata]